MAKLKLQEFIEEHSDWEVLLAEKPYCITITRDEVYGKKLVMFKYSQIDSNFNLEIVRECRGIILDETTFEVVSYAFDKFGNTNETYVVMPDASTMISTEKVDGSILKVVRIGDELLFSTNGTINAFNAPVAEQLGCKYASFGDVAKEVLFKTFSDKGLEWKDFIVEGNTYIFELVSPWTRVVIPYPANDLYLIGFRDNKTFNEKFFGDLELAKIFKTPKIYSFKTFDECVANAGALPWNEEGFVVMDAKFNRVKVKSSAWLATHHLRNNGVLSYERAVELVKLNELDEVIGYFPDFKQCLDKVKEKYDTFVASLEKAVVELDTWIKDHGYDKQPWWIEAGGQKRKDVAIFITKNFKVPGVGFAIIDKKVASAKEWVEQVPAKNLVRALGFKDV